MTGVSRPRAAAAPAAPQSIRLRRGPAAAAQAREFLTGLGWDGIVPDHDALRLVVSELVSNAVRHEKRRGRVSLTVTRRPGTLRIEVSPAGAAPANSEPWPHPDTPGGRGLGIVHALSDRCGLLPDDGGGAVVWCEFDT